ncbi:MAG: outer membrane lipoprotein carrier protein LolA [Bacteroidales bacterium]|nr:outer membrane lipoprotein carrier protein LolA [Bacteroidales bacterium]
MKKLTLIIAAFLSVFALSAQDVDGGATPILKKLAAKYAAYSTMKIDYTYKCEKNDKVLDSKTGTMTVKGGKYTFVFGNQTSYCDGKTLWNYQKDVNEVSIFEYIEEEDNLLNPAKILSDWDKEYRAKFIREDTEKNRVTQIIDLMPRNSSSFYKIRLIIDKAKQEIISVSAFEKDNTIYIYYIDKQIVNTPIDDTSFVFDMKKYPNVDVNDMR